MNYMSYEMHYKLNNIFSNKKVIFIIIVLFLATSFIYNSNSYGNEDGLVSIDEENDYYWINQNYLDITPAYAWNTSYEIDNYKSILQPKIIELFGIETNFTEENNLTKSTVSGIFEEISYEKYFLHSVDGIDIPIMKFYPINYNASLIYPAIIVFSGHGSYNDINFDHDSYQRAAALELAKDGYFTFSMENRGMGELSYLGNHNYIDSYANLVGKTWYGMLITDGLALLDNILKMEEINSTQIGVAGVSTGGALSLFLGALDNRISAVYDQGYFGSYKTTFGGIESHCLCNNIPNILLTADLNDIAILNYPKHLRIVNGIYDTFSYEEASNRSKAVEEAYRYYGAEGNFEFLSPVAAHIFSVDVATTFFNDIFSDSGIPESLSVNTTEQNTNSSVEIIGFITIIAIVYTKKYGGIS